MTALLMRVCLVGLVLLGVGCAHRPLAGGDLDRVLKPAFVSRIEDGAGPKALVFRDDEVYRAKLKKVEPKEADRRLQVKLSQVSRFELSDRFRASTLARLPKERPWNDVVDPALVGKQLESFLVEEVPANAPDFELLKPLGADAVVEFVVEEYGMHSSGGVSAAFVRGHARMFFIDGGDIWFRAFDADGLLDGHPLDPFKVAKDPDLFRDELARLVDTETATFAKDLTPKSRAGGLPLPPGGDELEGPSDATNKTGAPGESASPGLDEKPAPKKPVPAKDKKKDDSPLPSMEDQPAPVETNKPAPETGS